MEHLMLDDEITSKNDGARFTGELMQLRLDDIVPSASNPRIHPEKEAFAELKKSIRENGLLQPIVVRAVDGKFTIVGGHRRFAALCELAKEHADEERFQRVPALVIDVAESMVGVLQLAENVNRADLAPVEVGAAIAAAIESGSSADDVASSLGWNRKQLNRYLQLHTAPDWLKEFAYEVKVPKTRRDEHGGAVIDPVTQRPVVDVAKHKGLEFRHLCELVTAFNVLRQDDAEQLAKSGDGFKPRAERVVRRLASSAASEGWSVARLSSEVKKARKNEGGDVEREAKAKAPLVATKNGRAVINLLDARAATGEHREKLTAELTSMLAGMGYRVVVLKT
jgi:ParB family chromosome partitioning protein